MPEHAGIRGRVLDLDQSARLRDGPTALSRLPAAVARGGVAPVAGDDRPELRRVEHREALPPALRQGMEARDRPTVIDVAVTRDPGQMLPAVDNRTVEIKRGDHHVSAKRVGFPREPSADGKRDVPPVALA